MQIAVDITLVARLSRIANMISGLARLAVSACNGEYKMRPRRIELMQTRTRYVRVRVNLRISFPPLTATPGF